jgi:hypothetical protein
MVLPVVVSVDEAGWVSVQLYQVLYVDDGMDFGIG